MKLKRILCLLLILATAVFCAVSCDEEEDPTVNTIEIVEGSVATECTVGGTLDTANLKVKATYSDGSTKEIGVADLEVGQIDTSTPGKKTLTVSYGDKSAQLEITVKNAVTLGAVQIIDHTVPNEFNVGDTLDLSTVKFKLIYTDGSAQEIGYPYEGLEIVTPLDTSTSGTKEIVVRYGGKEGKLSVIVNDVVESIAVKPGSVLTAATLGAPLNTSNIVVLATYTNDEVVEVGIADGVEVSAADTATVGDKTLTITYAGVSTTFNYTVVENIVLVTVALKSGTFQTVYKPGEALASTDDIIAVLTYSDGNTEEVGVADGLTVTGADIDTSVSDEYTITLEYEDVTCPVTVTILAIKSIVITLEDSQYAIGDDLNTAGTVVVTYANDDYDEFTLSEFAEEDVTTDFDNTKAGTYTITVTYYGVQGNATVTVAEDAEPDTEGGSNLTPEHPFG